MASDKDGYRIFVHYRKGGKYLCIAVISPGCVSNDALQSVRVATVREKYLGRVVQS